MASMPRRRFSTPCGLASVAPSAALTMPSLQSLNCGWSAAGMPSMRAITRVGTGRAISATMSTRSPERSRSTTGATHASTTSVIMSLCGAMPRRVKLSAQMPRVWSCRSTSMLMIVSPPNIERKNSGGEKNA